MNQPQLTNWFVNTNQSVSQSNYGDEDPSKNYNSTIYPSKLLISCKKVTPKHNT